VKVRAGTGFAILINANAKRGGRRVAAQVSQALPGANVRLTKTVEELDDWVRHLEAPRAILSAGGDGTAVALLNSLRRVHGDHARFPVLGPIPLGTGNAWAHALGARKLASCIRSIERCDTTPPTRKYGLLDCDGTLTFFAGCGWDAQLLNDFHDQARNSPSQRAAKSVWGYLSALLVRTVPKTIVHGRPRVRVENLATRAYGITREGDVLPLQGMGRGSILYDGPASVAGAATCPEFGYHFRAYPHAERLLGMFNVRIYNVSTIKALRQIDELWKGTHPLSGMHDWFSTHIRMTFSRPVALQIGGEAAGMRSVVEYRAHPLPVDVVDWRRMID
jgi:diacylglycerol kinase family enzyme